MKYAAALLAAGASLAFAQVGDISSLPPCGQTCINNMLSIGTTFGCNPGDAVCYCSQPNFGYGVRDCALQACQQPGNAERVIQYGANFCANLLSSASATASGSALSILSSATESLASATSGSAVSVSVTTITSMASVSSMPVTTSALVATVTASDTSYATTTGFTTIFGAGAVASGNASSAASSALSSASSAAASASSALSSLLSSVSSGARSATSSAAGAASSVAGEVTSATAAGGAPMMTAAPLLGAAGMAALLFI